MSSKKGEHMKIRIDLKAVQWIKQRRPTKRPILYVFDIQIFRASGNFSAKGRALWGV